MITIRDKRECCGCHACQSVCPKQCIAMEVDHEGFLYPAVDVDKCIDCGACERVCPILVSTKEHRPIETVAAYCLDEEIRKNSSSGGVFSLLAARVIDEGGVVYGARFTEEWGVKHSKAETTDELALFRGSKYLQSEIGEVFKDVKMDLNSNRYVLFSGTPCQIAGLKNFLKKDYKNLLTVDFVCHGVPSPGVWKSYLGEQLRPQGAAAGKNTDFLSLNEYPVKGISFRDKRLGWKKYGFRLTYAASKGGKNSDSASKQSLSTETYQPFPDNPYMSVFLSNLSLRPSCYECPVKAGRSGSDITLGDFWGIENIDSQIDDDKGLSLVMINTDKGDDIFRSLDCFKKVEKYDEAVKYNPSIVHSVGVPPYRKYFMDRCMKKDFFKAYDAVISTHLLSRIRRKLWLKLAKRARLEQFIHNR